MVELIYDWFLSEVFLHSHVQGMILPLNPRSCRAMIRDVEARGVCELFDLKVLHQLTSER